ncbi:Uncharacterised protein [uncultured archaeon]|nr:Uncharacterised protein [uncultured archaeon]
MTDYFKSLKWLLISLIVVMSSLGFLQLFDVVALGPLALAFGIWGGLLMTLSIIWLMKLSSKYIRSTEQ